MASVNLHSEDVFTLVLTEVEAHYLTNYLGEKVADPDEPVPLFVSDVWAALSSKVIDRSSRYIDGG